MINPLTTTMLAPTLRRVLLQSPSQSFILPPVFLLPWRAQLSTVTNTTSPTPPPTAFRPQKPSPAAPSAAAIASSPPPPPSTAKHQPNIPPSSTPQPAALAPTLQSTAAPPSLLPTLAAQPPHYIIAHIHARPYLLTAGDKLRLPFYLANAPIGTTLRFNRASGLGSRDYTYRGSPWVDERFFVCRMRVIGVEGEPMRVVKKTKRRQRHVKTVKSKMRFTILRCVELRVLSGDEKAGEEESEDQIRR